MNSRTSTYLQLLQASFRGRILAAILLVVLTTLFSSVSYAACSHKKGMRESDPDEAALLTQLKQALIQAGDCSSGNNAACSTSTMLYGGVLSKAQSLAGSYQECASGASNPYFAQRQTMYQALAGDMQSSGGNAAIKTGTYIPSQYVQDLLTADIVSPTVEDVITKTAFGGTESHVLIKGQPPIGLVAETRIYVCVWPGTTNQADCMAEPVSANSEPLIPSSSGAPVFLDEPANPYRDEQRILLSANGRGDARLASPLSPGQRVTLVQIVTFLPGIAAVPLSQRTSTSPASSSVSSSSNDGAKGHFNTNCSESLGLECSLVGGVEFAGLSSQDLSTEPFIRLFVRTHPYPWFDLWGNLRLVGTPQQSGTSGITSAFTDPTGSIKTATLDGVGSSIDFELGGEHLWNWGVNKSWSNSQGPFIGYGATTPLTGNTLQAAYTVPAFGTVECNILAGKFSTIFSDPRYNIGKSDAGKQGTGSYPGAAAVDTCLINKNAPTTTTTGSTSTTTYDPVTTIGFASLDRHNFLSKYMVGWRYIFRRHQNDLDCGVWDPDAGTAPCTIGTLDASIGSDASITRGVMRFNRPIFKIDGVMPMPIAGGSWLYAFGSFSVRFKRPYDDRQDVPLVLQTASLTALEGTGSTAVPNTHTVVLPFEQPDRDFYRIGFGLDLICLVGKFAGGATSCSK